MIACTWVDLWSATAAVGKGYNYGELSLVSEPELLLIRAAGVDMDRK